MNPIARVGVVLGLLVVLWTFFMGFTGWYKNPTLLNLFFVVILIQIGVLIWGLKLTAQEGKAYVGQVVSGTLMSLIGGVIIFLGSLLFTTVVFPSYFQELRDLGVEMMRSQGVSEADISARLDAEARIQTPFMQALFGFLGTLVTGILASLVIAAFVRRK